MQISKKTQAELFELQRRADEIVPMAEKDGQVWVSFEQASILNSLNALEPSTGLQTKNPDGTLASTGKRVHAINPDYFFANRVLKKGKKLYVVSGHTTDGYRVIKEQASGRCFISHIPVYVISRDADDKLICESLTSVSSEDFVKSYTDTLDNHLMAEILPLIANFEKRQNIIQAMPI